MKKRKAVLAGCGGITKAWLPALTGFEDVEIVGLVDLVPEAIRNLKLAYDLSPVAEGSDLEEVIRKSGADTLFDCTVPSAHHDVVTTGLRLGCDVIGEKPMADSLAAAKEMVDVAAQTGRTYAVIQNRRYNPQIVRFRRSLESGAIGSLTTLNADFYIGAHFGGFRDEMEHPLLIDMAIHSFDEARYISHADPVSVYCQAWNPEGSWYRHGASAVAIFEMSNGELFTYRGSWCAEGMNTSWECAWRAVGTRGTLMWDGFDSITGEAVAADEGFIRQQSPISVEEAPELPHTGHAGVLREFLDSLQTGTRPQTDCRDNIKSVAMVYAAVESADSGQRVAIRW